MRLAKFLASAGIASRRAAEELIREGRVSVDGAIVSDPARDVGDGDVVAFDGEAIAGPEPRIVYAVNKPLGVVSTASDPQRRPTVVSLISSTLRLYPVGRLDLDTDGLILLTNDGALAHRLTHPSFEVPRTYRAIVGRPPVSAAALSALRRGVQLDDGRTAPARVRRVAPNAIEMTIHEGRNRQVRRMCEEVGHPVRRLTRVGFGPLKLGELAPGAHRRLSAAEIEALSRAGRSARRGAGGSSAAPPTRPRARRSEGDRRRAAGS
ncbi:MAG: pseudouridine synthase [Solirubrobacteraceae bacterium]